MKYAVPTIPANTFTLKLVVSKFKDSLPRGIRCWDT
jgi:hypothetical protein